MTQGSNSVCDVEASDNREAAALSSGAHCRIVEVEASPENGTIGRTDGSLTHEDPSTHNLPTLISGTTYEKFDEMSNLRVGIILMR